MVIVQAALTRTTFPSHGQYIQVIWWVHICVWFHSFFLSCSCDIQSHTLPWVCTLWTHYFSFALSRAGTASQQSSRQQTKTHPQWRNSERAVIRPSIAWASVCLAHETHHHVIRAGFHHPRGTPSIVSRVPFRGRMLIMHPVGMVGTVQLCVKRMILDAHPEYRYRFHLPWKEI